MESAAKRVVGRPFAPGQSGNPGGRRALPLTKALVGRVTTEQAEQLAQNLLAKALAGESWAMQMVWDRLEGKVPNRNEDGKPGDFDLDLSDVDTKSLRAALKRIK
jgi:hypothetical protein